MPKQRGRPHDSSNKASGWMDFDDPIKSIITAAERGDTNAAQQVLEAFCDTVEDATGSNGKPLRVSSGSVFSFDDAVFVYLAKCFRMILEGIPADKALGLRPGESGRPTKSPRERLKKDADLVREVKNFRLKGLKVKDAISRAASLRSVKQSAVEHAWKNKYAQIVAGVLTRREQGK